MDIPSHKSWMYNIYNLGRGGIILKFLDDVEMFIKHACNQSQFDTGLIMETNFLLEHLIQHINMTPLVTIALEYDDSQHAYRHTVNEATIKDFI